MERTQRRRWHGSGFVLLLHGFLGCAGAQMPEGEPDPCMPAIGPVLERDMPGCRAGSLLDIAEGKVERGEEVARECAELHMLIPQIPEAGERVLLWMMVSEVEAQAGLFCHGTITRAYADAALLGSEHDRRGARQFVRSAEGRCLGARELRKATFPQ